MKITKAMIDKEISFDSNTYYGEASTLGLPTGRIPKTIETDLGNGKSFQLHHHNEEVFKYLQPNSVIRLEIFND